MPRKVAGRSTPHHRSWKQRLQSKAFKRTFTTVLTAEFKSLATLPVASVLDAKLVRELIAQCGAHMMNREAVADLVVDINRRAGKRLNRRRESLLELLDPALVADIDALLDEEVAVTESVEDFIAALMRQEFIQRLFTDVVFTAIVSFNKRVNPLFGALAVQVLEEQIKGFIRLFMPMLQRQATAFAINPANQRMLLNFTRAIIRQLLNEPLSHYAAMVSTGQRRKGEALIRTALTDPRIEPSLASAAVAAWDDLYAVIRDRKVGDLLRLDEHAHWLAERSVEMILPALLRPQLLQFVADEMARAAADVS